MAIGFVLNIVVIILTLSITAWVMLTRKIRLPCGPCEQAKWWYRCTNGTGLTTDGKKSEMCIKRENIVPRTVKIFKDALQELQNATLNSPLLKNLIDTVKNIKDDVQKRINKIVQDVWELIQTLNFVPDLVNIFQKIMNLKDTFINNVSKYISDVVASIKKFGEVTRDRILAATKDVKQFIIDTANEVYKSIMSIFNDMLGGVPEAINVVVEIVKNISDIVTTVVTQITGVVDSLLSFINKFVTDLKSFFENFTIDIIPNIEITTTDVYPFKDIKTVEEVEFLIGGLNVLEPINLPLNGINFLIEKIRELPIPLPEFKIGWGFNIFQPLITLFKTLEDLIKSIEGILDTVTAPLQALADISSMISKLFDFSGIYKIRDLIVKNLNIVKDEMIARTVMLFEQIKQDAKNLVDRILNGEFVQRIRKLFTDIYDKVQTVLTKFKGALTDSVNLVWRLIKRFNNVLDTLYTSMMSIKDNIVSVVTDMFNELYKIGSRLLTDTAEVAKDGAKLVGLEIVGYIPKDVVITVATVTVFAVCLMITYLYIQPAYLYLISLSKAVGLIEQPVYYPQKYYV